MRRLLLAGAFAALLACAETAPRPTAAADLTNPRLSPERSQWLVGAIARLATREELAAYLALDDDAAAAAFEEDFWARRDPDPARPGNPLRELFDQRARDADRRFSEAGYLGRRTDRGTVFVLHGEPKSIDFELNPERDGPPIEVWTYEKEAAGRLDGRAPETVVYRFYKPADLTVRYHRVTQPERPLVPPRPGRL